VTTNEWVDTNIFQGKS